MNKENVNRKILSNNNLLIVVVVALMIFTWILFLQKHISEIVAAILVVILDFTLNYPIRNQIQNSEQLSKIHFLCSRRQLNFVYASCLLLFTVLFAAGVTDFVLNFILYGVSTSVYGNCCRRLSGD